MLKAQANGLKESIEKQFNRQFTEDGRNGVEGRQYIMSAEITLDTAANENDAIATVADYVVEVGNRRLQNAQDKSFGNGVAYNLKGENFDRMAITVEGGRDPAKSQTSAHEFTHLLGVGLHSNRLNDLTNGVQNKGTRSLSKEDFFGFIFNQQLTDSKILTATTPQKETRRSLST